MEIREYAKTAARLMSSGEWEDVDWQGRPVREIVLVGSSGVSMTMDDDGEVLSFDRWAMLELQVA